MKDLYEFFASDYDLFGTPEEYIGKESDFFARLFELYGVKTVLDCSCGTGRHLYEGRFVAMDFTGDGKWDHCGYITQADDYSAYWSLPGTSYPSLYYWDYKVAQNTGDYHLWASNQGNSWDLAVYTRPNNVWSVAPTGA